jgi:hypothetical protein
MIKGGVVCQSFGFFRAVVSSISELFFSPSGNDRKKSSDIYC